jgi:uncharacterized RDD family membrane protein YckC
MEQNFATLGKRILGGIIDVVIIAAFFYLYLLFFGKETSPGEYYVSGFSAFIMFLIMFLYFVILEKLTGKTLGKLIAKTRVVNADGNKISWGQSLVRNIIRPIDGIIVGLVAIIAIASSEKKQRLGDMLARTYVIKA